MVRTLHLRMNVRGDDFFYQVFGDEEIVDSPAHIPFPRPAFLIPPGIIAAF